MCVVEWYTERNRVPDGILLSHSRRGGGGGGGAGGEGGDGGGGGKPCKILVISRKILVNTEYKYDMSIILTV